jgi:hypothetical protein
MGPAATRTLSQPALVVLTCLIALLAVGVPTAGTAETGGATVRDGDGRPCPAIDREDPDRPRGGCVTKVDGSLIAVSVRMMVGDMDFAKCSYAHRLRVDAAGRTSIEQIKSVGPDMCNDVTVCKKDRASTPWEGRIRWVRDGAFVNVVNACFDTCMGQFVGRLEMRFERANGGWRAVPRHDLVGATGLELDGGDWTIPTGRLVVADR